MDGHRGSSTLQSSLSPLAQPFNPQSPWNMLSYLGPFTPSQVNSQGSDPHFSSLDSSSDLNLDAFEHRGYQSDTGITDLPYFHPSVFEFDAQSGNYLGCPSSALEGESTFPLPYESNFDPAQLTKSTMPNHTQNLLGCGNVVQGAEDGDGPSSDGHQGNSSWKEVSNAYESFPKQGGIHGKLTGAIIGGDNQINSRATEGVNSESFSTSSDKYSTAIVQEVPYDQRSYPMPLVTGRSNLNIDFPLSEHTVSPLPVNHSFPAQSFGSQGSSTTVSPLDPVLSVDANFLGINPHNKNENSSGPEKPHALLNAKGKEVCLDQSMTEKRNERKSDKGKEVCLDQSLIEKGNERKADKGKEVCLDLSLTEKANERKSDKPVFYDKIEPSLMVKSELQSLAIKTDVSVESSSKTQDENDPDVDSPCYRGRPFGLPYGVPGSVNSVHLEKKPQTKNSLNPLAPDFFPSNTKGCTDYLENESHGSVFSSFEKGESSAVNLSSRKHRSMDYIKLVLHPPERSNETGTQCSSDIYEAKKDYALINNSRGSSLLKSAHVVQQSFLEDSGKLVTGASAEASLKGIEDVISSALTHVPVIAKRQAPCLSLSPSSSAVDLPDLTETRQDVSKSLSTAPKPDVQIVINAMHHLTGLLVHSSGLHSLNANELEIIQHIIHELSMLYENKVGQKVSMPESSKTGTSYCSNHSAKHAKCSDMELRVAWTKNLAFPRESEHQNHHEAQKVYCARLTENGLDSFTSCSDVWVEKNDMIQMQVIADALTEKPGIKEEMHPEAVFYKNLWLKTLSALKYTTYALSMGYDRMDGCKSIKK